MEINLGHSAITKEIYLDNAATTRVMDSVCQKMVEVMTKDFGNPSALHMKGFDAEQYVKEAPSPIIWLWWEAPWRISAVGNI